MMFCRFAKQRTVYQLADRVPVGPGRWPRARKTRVGSRVVGRPEFVIAKHQTMGLMGLHAHHSVGTANGLLELSSYDIEACSVCESESFFVALLQLHELEFRSNDIRIETRRPAVRALHRHD